MPNGEDRLGRGERGIKYPADNLEVAIELLTRVRDSLGYGGASRETLAEALGYKGISGTSARKIGALTHYDLLERVGNGAYRISELGRRILMPTSTIERQEAIAEAATRPALFAALIQKYQDHALPSMLPNLLTREHGVASVSAEQAATTFRETAEFAGLLRNGVLRAKAALEAEPPIQRAAEDEPSARSTAQPSTAQPSSAPATDPYRTGRSSDYTVPLDGTGRTAVLTIPLPATLRDMKRIRAWTDYMSRVLEEENEDLSRE